MSAVEPGVKGTESGAATLVRKREFGPAMLSRLWRKYSEAGD